MADKDSERFVLRALAISDFDKGTLYRNSTFIDAHGFFQGRWIRLMEEWQRWSMRSGVEWENQIVQRVRGPRENVVRCKDADYFMNWRNLIVATARNS